MKFKKTGCLFNVFTIHGRLPLPPNFWWEYTSITIHSIRIYSKLVLEHYHLWGRMAGGIFIIDCESPWTGFSVLSAIHTEFVRHKHQTQNMLKCPQRRIFQPAAHVFLLSCHLSTAGDNTSISFRPLGGSSRDFSSFASSKNFTFCWQHDLSLWRILIFVPQVASPRFPTA